MRTWPPRREQLTSPPEGSGSLFWAAAHLNQTPFLFTWQQGRAVPPHNSLYFLPPCLFQPESFLDRHGKLLPRMETAGRLAWELQGDGQPRLGSLQGATPLLTPAPLSWALRGAVAYFHFPCFHLVSSQGTHFSGSYQHYTFLLMNTSYFSFSRTMNFLFAHQWWAITFFCFCNSLLVCMSTLSIF